MNTDTKQTCPGCGAVSTEDYDGAGTCWKCFSGASDQSQPSNGNGDDPGSPAAVLRDHLDWLVGVPMDPAATPADTLPSIPGFPFAHPGAGVVIVGPTGGGRSSLVQACLYDGTASSLRAAYLGSEVTEPEFNARAGVLAELRGDTINDALRERLAQVRYLNLASVVTHGWAHPEGWVAGITDAYDVVVIDPLSAVASALDLNFDQSNAEFVKFYDRLVQPLVTKNVTVVMVENVGHAIEAKTRAKGASAKSDRADLTFSCALTSTPPALVIKAHKVRTVRASFQRGDEWIFYRDSQTVEPRATGKTSATGYWRPTDQMERASDAIAAEPGIGKKNLRTLLPGRNDTTDAAIFALITEGYIDLQQDSRGGHHHHPIKPFKAEDDPGPCPDRAHNTVPRVPTVPHSVPDRAHVPDEHRAHRAIHSEAVWARGTSSDNGHPFTCCCQDGGDEPDPAGLCTRCGGKLQSEPADNLTAGVGDREPHEAVSQPTSGAGAFPSAGTPSEWAT